MNGTPLANQVEWLSYVDNAVAAQGVRHSQAAISAKVKSAIPNTTLHQITDDLDEMYEAALVAKDELYTITNNVANSTNGSAGFRPEYADDGTFLNGLKGRDRALEKINGDYAGDASRLVDIAGSKIIYETLDETYLAYDYIFANYEVLLIKAKDRLIDPDNLLQSRYRDILMNLKMSNGHIVEMRLHIRGIEDIAPQEHILYQQRRSIEAQALAENRPLTPQEEATIEALIAEARTLYDAAWAVIIQNN